MGCDQLEELVVPGLLVSVLLLCSLGQNVARSGEEVKLGSCICFAKDAELIDLQYKYTAFIPDKQIIRLLFESDKQVLTINCPTF